MRQPHKARRKLSDIDARAIVNSMVFERLSHHLEHVARKLWQLIEEQKTLWASETSPAAGQSPPQ